MWRVDSSTGYVASDDAGTITADPETTGILDREAGKPVASLAGVYRPTSLKDPIWPYAMALAVLAPPHRISGNPPRIPAVEGNFPADAVF